MFPDKYDKGKQQDEKEERLAVVHAAIEEFDKENPAPEAPFFKAFPCVHADGRFWFGEGIWASQEICISHGDEFLKTNLHCEQLIGLRDILHDTLYRGEELPERAQQGRVFKHEGGYLWFEAGGYRDFIDRYQAEFYICLTYEKRVIKLTIAGDDLVAWLREINRLLEYHDELGKWKEASEALAARKDKFLETFLKEKLQEQEENRQEDKGGR